jgi:hypothetical protein
MRSRRAISSRARFAVTSLSRISPDRVTPSARARARRHPPGLLRRIVSLACPDLENPAAA